jgi:hypothetical protein
MKIVYDLGSMTRLKHLTALSVCALLLAAPTAFGCGGPGMMAADCPMIGMDEMGEMAHSESSRAASAMASAIPSSSCHESDQVAEDCCDVEPAPEPIQAPTFETVKLLIALEATDLPVMASLAPPLQSPNWRVPEGLREHDVGRYTLFSSLLL